MVDMLHGHLADTHYFEQDARSGNRYGVWVTTPPGYADSAQAFPLLYVLDGNWTVGLTAPLIAAQADPFTPIAPYIQVTVGYAGEEADAWAHLRNRDLIPPAEPVSASALTGLEAARASGVMTQEALDAYVEELSDTHADVFLDFLINELHGQLRSRLRVKETGHGLFGYSYGGLFCLYAWLRLGSGGLFSTVGAGSPGVASPDSEVFRLVAALPAKTPERGGAAPRLHITLNEAELLGEVAFYREIARNVLDVVDRIHAQGLTQSFTSAVLHETHLTGLQASFMSYLRSCHTRSRMRASSSGT